MKAELLKACNESGIETLRPFQQETYEKIQSGKTVVLQAETGAGKTIAYLLPILDQIDPQDTKTQALILVPTRELAEQVRETAERLSTYLRIHCVKVTGGTDEQEMNNLLKQRPQILIGTVGRLKECFDTLDLSHLKWLVIDEADAVLEQEDITKLFNENIQHIYVSATPLYIKEALTVIESPNILNENVQLRYVYSQDKQTELLFLLHHLPITRAIVFVQYRSSCDKITDLLKTEGILAASFSAYLSQRERNAILKEFKEGKIRVLVATDAAARGLDFAISHVIHYDPPQDAELLAHRSGRSGHQGNEGMSIFLLTENEQIPAGAMELTDNDFGSTDLSKPLPVKAEPKPQVSTFLIWAGKKDKIRKKDLVGALCALVPFDQIGVVEVREDSSIFTILKPDYICTELKVKGKRYKAEPKKN